MLVLNQKWVAIILQQIHDPTQRAKNRWRMHAESRWRWNGWMNVGVAHKNVCVASNTPLTRANIVQAIRTAINRQCEWILLNCMINLRFVLNLAGYQFGLHNMTKYPLAFCLSYWMFELCDWISRSFPEHFIESSSFLRLFVVLLRHVSDSSKNSFYYSRFCSFEI